MIEKEIFDQLPEDVRVKILPCLKVLADSGLLSLIARANANHLVDGRMDSDPEVIAKEVLEVRQANRILLGLEASAKEMTKGIENES